MGPQAHHWTPDRGCCRTPAVQSSGGGPVQQGGPLSGPTSPPPRCEVGQWQRRPPGGGGDALVSVRGLTLMRAACMHACARVHTGLCMSMGARLRASRERLLGLGVRPTASGGAGWQGEGASGWSWGPSALGCAFTVCSHTRGSHTFSWPQMNASGSGCCLLVNHMPSSAGDVSPGLPEIPPSG